MRSALESRDVNRLAEYYHWSGMGTATGYRLMERLGAFSERPWWMSNWSRARSRNPMTCPDQPLLPQVIDPFAPDDAETGREPAAAPAPRRPTCCAWTRCAAASDLGIQATYFHLRSNAGCWWMQF